MGIIALALDVSAKSDQALVLWLTNHTQMRILLQKCPKVLFDKDSVIVSSPAATFRYLAKDISKFTYEDADVVGLGSIDNAHDYQKKGDVLYFDKSVKASDITIYSIDGKRVPIQFVSTGNSISVSISDLPSGAYVLSCQGKTAKFLKR